MTTYQWGTIRTKLAQAFHEGPSNNIEARILQIFEHSPALVDTMANDVIKGHKEGRIRSAWPFLATSIERAAEGSTITSQDTTEQDTAIRSAEQWVRAAGVHYDSQTEVEDELFGHRGRLRHWATDEPLRKRMLDLWQTERPRGEQAERDMLAYQETLRQQRPILQRKRQEQPAQ